VVGPSCTRRKGSAPASAPDARGSVVGRRTCTPLTAAVSMSRALPTVRCSPRRARRRGSCAHGRELGYGREAAGLTRLADSRRLARLAAVGDGEHLLRWRCRNGRFFVLRPASRRVRAPVRTESSVRRLARALEERHPLSDQLLSGWVQLWKTHRQAARARAASRSDHGPSRRAPRPGRAVWRAPRRTGASGMPTTGTPLPFEGHRASVTACLPRGAATGSRARPPIAACPLWSAVTGTPGPSRRELGNFNRWPGSPTARGWFFGSDDRSSACSTRAIPVCRALRGIRARALGELCRTRLTAHAVAPLAHFSTTHRACRASCPTAQVQRAEAGVS